MEIGEAENRPNYYINIIITEAICLTLVFLLILSLKFISKAKYKSFKKFYDNKICADTSISEVLE